MNYIRTILAALVLLSGACIQAFAQLEVRLESPRRDYILGENATLKITIVNHTDTSVALNSIPGRSWLSLQVQRRGESLPLSPSSVPRYPGITISPGSSRAYNISLKPHYNLGREGTYSVVATLRLPDMRTTYSSNAAMINMISGSNVRSYTVQARGQRLKMCLKSLHVNGKDVLFGQVMNEDTRQALGACYLGQYLNFMPPRVLLDRAQNLHMLCQSSADYFTYAVMDTFGNRREYKVMTRTGGPVDIVSTGGGIRCVGLKEYKKPKSDRDTYHSATDRP